MSLDSCTVVLRLPVQVVDRRYCAWSGGWFLRNMDTPGAETILPALENRGLAMAAKMPARRAKHQATRADTPTDLSCDNPPRLRQFRAPSSSEVNIDNDRLFHTTLSHDSSSYPNDPAIRPSKPRRAESNASNSSLDDDEEYTNSAQTSTGWNSFATAAIPSRLMMLAFILLVAFSLLHEHPILANAGTTKFGASAGPIDTSRLQKKDWVDGKLLISRQNTDTDVCSRWSQQSALVNGTIYVYGGHATTTQGQTSNTWNNDFFTIDVTKSWDISAPVVSGLAQPSGPPNISNGYLWNSYDSLFLYGGEFSDTPFVTPSSFSLWEYNIAKSSWTEHQNPQTSAGNNSDPANQPVQRAAEGAGISVPELGRGFYFAGHVDQSTTSGWSNQIFRVYLKSLLEYTFPGYTNNGVQNLAGGKTAGSDGTFRNITQGGIQDTATFPNRADSALVYVPGYGASGILVSMGGGTNVSFVSPVRQLNEKFTADLQP